MKEYTEKDIEVLTYVECVVRRPNHWTANGSLGEVIALLDGFEEAVMQSRTLNIERPSPSDALRWLTNEVNLKDTNYSNWQYIPELVKKYGSEKKVLEVLEIWLKNLKLKLKKDKK